MKNHIRTLLLFGALTLSYTMSGQNMAAIRINEVQSVNTDGYIDDYGCRNGWIELFNTSYGTVDIGGCYLTDDPNDLTKYMIPKGDALTKIPPRQHVLFYADNLPDRGTFHISFDIPNAKQVIFVSNNGRTIIDEVTLPEGGIPANKSYGRVVDGEGSSEPTHFLQKSIRVSQKERAAGEDHGWAILDKVTPSTNNLTLDGDSKSTTMGKTDPYGVIMAIIAMSVVFVALILLYVVFKKIGNRAVIKSHLKEAASKGDVASVASVRGKESTSAEVFAAIAMAFHLYKEDNEIHDFENTILTIHKESKSYSPWSSKIYTLRETPQVRRNK